MTDRKAKAKTITRRTFLTAGGFFITSLALPVIPDASGDAGSRAGTHSLLAPTVAYAKDSEATFEVSVTTESTIVFKAVDVTQLASDTSASDLPAVAGAKITCYDPASKKTYSGEADSHGFFSIDIADGTKKSDKSWEPAYSTNLQVSVTHPGHRDVTIFSLYVQGATLYYLPCPTAKEEAIYFRAIGFDDLDVQYTKASFLYASTNDSEHTLRAQVCLTDGEVGDAAVHFYRWRPKTDTFPGERSSDVKDLGFIRLDFTKPISSDGADANTYDVQLKGRFLISGSDQAFEAGDRLVVGVIRDDRRCFAVTLAEFKKAPFDNTGTGNLDTLPGVSFSGDNSFKIPDKVPIIGGGKFSMWQPSHFLVFNWSPFGYLKIGVTAGAIGESPDGQSWKFSSVEKGNDQLAELQKKNKESIDKAVALGKQQNAAGAQGLDKYYSSEIMTKFTLSLGASVYVDAAYEWLDTKAWKVGLGGAISVKGEALYTQQIMIGPVPVFLSLSIGLGLTIAAKVGGVTYWPDGDDEFLTKVGKFLGGMTLDWKNTQCAFVIAFDMSVTGGVGVAGVASIGLRYAAGLTLYISYFEEAKGAGDATYQYPHSMVMLDMSVSIAIQFFLFKYDKTLWSLKGDERKLYDSWAGKKSSTASLEESGIAALADDSVPGEGDGDGISRDEDGNYAVSLEYLAENATEVTADELAGAREFSTSAQTSSQAASLGEDEAKLVSVAHPDGSGLYTMVCGTDDDIARVRAGLGYDDAETVPDDDAAAVAVALSDDAAAQADGGSEGYVYPDTGITVDEGSYDRSKLVSGESEVSSISGIADDGGVSATSGKLLSNVFSDGRPKFMEIDGVMTMFRIAAVNCGGQMRTRLVVQRKEDGKWSDPAPIDFNPTGIDGLTRDQLYDYDFDIATLNPVSAIIGYESPHNDVVILLFSGTRDYSGVADNSAARLEASSGQHVSTIIDYGPTGPGQFSVKTSFSWRTFADAASYGDNQILAFMPRVNVQARLFSALLPNSDVADPTLLVCVSCAYAYKHQSKGANTSILSSDVPTHIAVATTQFESVSDSFGTGYLSVVRALQNVSGGVFDGFGGNAVYITNGPAVITEAPLRVDGNCQWNSYFGVQVERKNTQGKAEKAFGVMKVAASGNSTQLKHTPSVFYQPDASVKRLVPWPGQDAMIAMRQAAGADGEKYDVAYRVEFDLKGDGGSFPAGTQIGPSTGLPLDFMITSSGKALLYADNRSGKKNVKYDEKGNPVLDESGMPATEDAEGDFYRIMAMKVVEDNGKFALSKPFSACTLSHAVDSVVAVAAENESTSIIALEISDISKSLANYWEISVPCIACATPTDLVAVDGLILPGQPCTFEVELRNDGNTILCGTELRLVDGETNAVLYDNVSVEFNAQTVVASSDSRAASDDPAGSEELKFETGYEALGDHMLAKDGGRNVLAPGRFARVRATITVPTDWKNKHKIVVKTTKLTYLDPITSDKKTTISLAVPSSAPGMIPFDSNLDILYKSGFIIAGLGEEGKDSEYVHFGEQGDDAYCNVTVGLGSEANVHMGYSETMWSDDGNGGGGSGSDGSGSGSGDGGSGSGGSGSGSSSASKKGTPNTGDPTFGGIAGMAAAAAGAIGMGLAAYSNRRLEVEREEHELLEVDAEVIDDEI